MGGGGWLGRWTDGGRGFSAQSLEYPAGLHGFCPCWVITQNGFQGEDLGTLERVFRIDRHVGLYADAFPVRAGYCVDRSRS